MGASGIAQLEPELELVRISVRSEGAFGVLQALHRGEDGAPIAVTCERTYPLPDAPRGQLLKIPAGRHRCVRSYFQRGRYETFEILVPGAEHSRRLLFHKGNTESDLEGCVAVARRFGVLLGRPAVLESAEGFADFMAWAGRRQIFGLLVRHAA